MNKACLAAIATCVGVAWTLWPAPAQSHETANTTVTFDREVSRILKKKCIACHSPANLAFPLTSYEETRPWARAIEEEVLRRHMPPWRAVPGYGQFANDGGLTNRELQLMVAWIEGNGPKNPAQRIIVNVDQIQSSPQERLRPDFDVWQFGRPDLVRQLNPSRIESRQPDHVRSVVIDPGVLSARWVRGLEFKPGDRRVLRAAFFSVQETGQWLGSWTPWYGMTSLPRDTAGLLPAGSHVVAELHYRGTDGAVDERGTLGIYFARSKPARCTSDLNLTSDTAPSPGPRGARIQAAATLQTDTVVVAIKPELGPAAYSLELTARQPDGTAQVLLFVKDILPEWPTPYIFKEPLRLPRGTVMLMTSYDREPGGAGPRFSPGPGAPPRAAGIRLMVSLADGNACSSGVGSTRARRR